MSTASTRDLETIADPARAAMVLHPLRRQILRWAATPRSATQIAALLQLPRQNVNYHVRELARARLLRKAGRVRKRNFVEQLWRATARSYALAPGMLGPLGTDPTAVQEGLGAAHLIALGAQVQGEVARARREAQGQGKRLPTLALDAELRFQSAAQRERFTLALRDAVARVIAEHASPAQFADGAAAKGRPHRLAIACYPIPSRDRDSRTGGSRAAGQQQEAAPAKEQSA